MKLKVNGVVRPEIKEYLLSQDGITNVDVNYDDFFIEINVEHDDKVTPVMVMKYIDLFCEYKYSRLVEFNKVTNKEVKILKYNVYDMCCEFCYMNLMQDLLENDNIISAKSDYDLRRSAFNVNFTIEYINSSEEDIIKYIKEHI